MAEWTSEQRLKGINYANKLDLFAMKAPDPQTEHATHELAREIRKRFTWSIELRKREIMVHVRKQNDFGGISINELIEATGYKKDILYPLATELESEHVIELRAVTPIGPRGRGRPAIRLFLAGNGNFSVRKT